MRKWLLGSLMKCTPEFYYWDQNSYVTITSDQIIENGLSSHVKPCGQVFGIFLLSVAHLSEELKLAIIQTLRTLVKNSECRWAEILVKLSLEKGSLPTYGRKKETEVTLKLLNNSCLASSVISSLASHQCSLGLIQVCEMVCGHQFGCMGFLLSLTVGPKKCLVLCLVQRSLISCYNKKFHLL